MAYVAGCKALQQPGRCTSNCMRSVVPRHPLGLPHLAQRQVHTAAAEQDPSQEQLPACSISGQPISSTEGSISISSVPASSGTSSSRRSILQTDGRQLAQLLQKLSELHVKPHGQWLQDVLDTLEPQLANLEPAELSGCLRVLGGWSFTPTPHFMRQLHLATQQQLQQQRLTLKHIGDMTWGLAQLQNPQQPLLNDLLSAAGALMTHGKPDEDCSSAVGMADLVWAVAKLQHKPGHDWLSSFSAASQPLLMNFTPQQLAQVVWAFARLPYQPEQAWKDLFLRSVEAHLLDFDSKSISLCAWGLATLKFSTTARFMFIFERQAERVLSTLEAAELACTLWALSELKSKRPHELRLGRLVRRQEVFWQFDFQLLANPRLLRVVRHLTLGPQQGSSR